MSNISRICGLALLHFSSVNEYEIPNNDEECASHLSNDEKMI
jgi:hypothetical protein